MYQPWRLKRIVSIMVCFLLHAQGADKFTDESRPYEFGFKIEGQQHRHEEKDKDGIIMGEFGFITADDVYHVTVYATDKEGRFKILSMKNIHLKSSSINPTTSARRGHSFPLPPAIFNTPGPPQVSHVESASIEPPGKACSSCSLPTTTTRAPQPAPSIYNQNNNNYNSPNQFGPPQYQQSGGGSPVLAPPSVFGSQTDNRSQPNFLQQKQQPNIDQTNIQQSEGSQNYLGGEQSDVGGGSVPYNNNPEQTAYPNNPGAQNFGPQPELGGSKVYTPQSASSGEALPEQIGQQNPSFPYPRANSQVSPGSLNRNPKQYFEQQFDSNVAPNYSNQKATGPAKPALFAAQMQIVDKNTDIHHLNPGEMHGLPPGLTKEDMVRLLYTFNYTLGFQGHFEEGYNNGVKKGYYFVTGRDGVRMRIDYVADDTGFHPKVSQDVFDLSSEEVPKPETEKDEKYGLKGYEFKWLYYPVGSKKR